MFVSVIIKTLSVVHICIIKDIKNKYIKIFKIFIDFKYTPELDIKAYPYARGKYILSQGTYNCVVMCQTGQVIFQARHIFLAVYWYITFSVFVHILAGHVKIFAGHINFWSHMPNGHVNQMLNVNPCTQHQSVMLNSLRPSDAYMRQQNKPSLVLIMVCHLFSTKPLSEPMLTYCQLDPKEQYLVKL